MQVLVSQFNVREVKFVRHKESNKRSEHGLNKEIVLSKANLWKMIGFVGDTSNFDLFLQERDFHITRKRIWNMNESREGIGHFSKLN